jgi:hypothetical protein
MTKFFTHYWSNPTWINNQRFSGELLDHIAGNMFVKRNVRG